MGKILMLEEEGGLGWLGGGAIHVSGANNPCYTTDGMDFQKDKSRLNRLNSYEKQNDKV